MIKVGRPINGISLNGLEWLLDDKGEEMLFESKYLAMKFLRENGFDLSDVDMEDVFIFKDPDANKIIDCADCCEPFKKSELIPWRYEGAVKLCENCTQSRDEEEQKDEY